MKKHAVAKLSVLAVAFALLVGTSVLATPVTHAASPVTHAASSSATAGANAPSPYTIINVGGGTWNYGTQLCGGLNCKYAWSHYVHNSLRHSATSICGSSNIKVFANATLWANADAYCGWGDSTAAYWNTYTN